MTLRTERNFVMVVSQVAEEGDDESAKDVDVESAKAVETRTREAEVVQIKTDERGKAFIYYNLYTTTLVRIS